MISLNLLKVPTNCLGYVGRVHPKPLCILFSDTKGIQWVCQTLPTRRETHRVYAGVSEIIADSGFYFNHTFALCSSGKRPVEGTFPARFFIFRMEIPNSVNGWLDGSVLKMACKC
jgi:hypothetical protein